MLMSDPVRVLSDDEVRQIKLIMESLDRSTLDFLQLEFGDVKLMMGKGAPPTVGTAMPASTAPLAEPVQTAVPQPRDPSTLDTARPSGDAAKGEDSQKNTVAITAPMIGRFYAQPEPGAAPFVTVGSEVKEDTTVAILEVMKMFNAVQAGMRGVVTQICVEDAQFVEFGQVLFRVRPQAS